VIYLDNNATTAVDPEVYDAILSSLKRDTGNPSSVHLAGRRVKERIEHGRSLVAGLIGCTPSEILFTSGGTESNNLALIGHAAARGKGHIVVSAVEHPSVLHACRHLETRGFGVSYAPVGLSGMLDPDDLRRLIKKDTFLISVMHSNNETGAIQPVGECSRIAKEHGIAFHTDAAQSIGKTPFSAGPYIDMATVVSHKFYGPKGVGALYVRNGTALSPMLFGAGHEQGIRPGTENVGGIVGLGKACEIAVRDLKLRVSRTSQLSEMLLERLKAQLPDIALNAEEAPRLPNTLSLRIPGVNANDLVYALRDSVAFSSGSACHAAQCSPSGVLKQMGLSDQDALSTIRLSVGKDNSEDEIVRAAELIAGAASGLRKSHLPH